MKTPTPDLDLGAHLTFSKGIPAGLRLCRDLGGTCLQYFTRNPRGGAQRAFPEAELEAGRALRAGTGVRTVIGHLPYVLNPANPDPHSQAFAREVLALDLRLADRLGAAAVVLHPGRHVGTGVEAGVAAVAAVLRAALDGYEGRASLLLEAMAGQGTELGSRPAELAAIIDAAGGHPALGVCLDSCHQFAGGWDLRTPEGVEAMVADFAAAVGRDRLRCLHLNDCKSALGSHLDRHERIGRGALGEAGIRAVVTNPFLATLPMCLETPVDDLAEYADEIRAVRRIAAGAPDQNR